MKKDYHEKLTEIRVRFPSKDAEREIPDYLDIIRNRAKKLGFEQSKGKTKGEGNVNAYILDLIQKDLQADYPGLEIITGLTDKKQD